MKLLLCTISVLLCIFVLYTPNVQAISMGNTTSPPCETYNNTDCRRCLQNIMCYWCGNTDTCMTIDFIGLVSTTCPVDELFVTQCELNGLYSIIIIVAAVLLFVGLLICLPCLLCCICCCCLHTRKNSLSKNLYKQQMKKIEENKTNKRLKREKVTSDIKNKYLDY